MKKIVVKEAFRVGEYILDKGDVIRIKMKEGVAEEILRQIKTLDKRALMAWGAKNMIAQDKPGNDIIDFHKRYLGYLQMDVKGGKFKGRILVVLMPNDTYTIIAGLITGMNWKIKKIEDDVYAENLVQVLDEIIG